MRNARKAAALAIVVLIGLTGCARDETQIQILNAYLDGGITLGGAVPQGIGDSFDIVVCIHGARGWVAGDTFKAALEVGVAGNETKYGFASGLKFKLLTSSSGTVTPMIGCPAAPMFRGSRRLYFASLSAPPEKITCTTNNNLIYSVEGIPADRLKFRIRTAGMRRNTYAQVRYDSFTSGEMSRAFSCMGEERVDILAGPETEPED